MLETPKDFNTFVFYKRNNLKYVTMGNQQETKIKL